MALNFSRCVAIFGSSWSNDRLPNTTFLPSPLMGCLVARELVGEIRRLHRTARTYAGRWSLAHGTPGPPPPWLPGTTPDNSAGATRGANSQRPAGKQFQGTAFHEIYPVLGRKGCSRQQGLPGPSNRSWLSLV